MTWRDDTDVFGSQLAVRVYSSVLWTPMACPSNMNIVLSFAHLPMWLPCSLITSFILASIPSNMSCNCVSVIESLMAISLHCKSSVLSMPSLPPNPAPSKLHPFHHALQHEVCLQLSSLEASHMHAVQG